jgi:predicted DCC family thiol-disulfide oxidoreductase YuxK
MPKVLALLRSARDLLAAFSRAWSEFWFHSSPSTPLELTRIGVGAALLLHYAMATPYLFDFWGESGWLPRELVLQDTTDPWIQSVFFYFTARWQWIAFHALFLFCCAALILGWRTSWVKWIVLIGQISYDHRNPMVVYGVDKILACLLFIMCVAPIGRALSLDRVRAVRAAKLEKLEATLPPFTSPWMGACTRLMQIQMAVVFFYSAVNKLRGDEWWNGDVVWHVFTTDEFYSRVFSDLLASHYWIGNLATYVTIVIEIAFPFLIWQRRTRPYLLAAAIFLHVQFALFMALVYFSFVMMMGHMSFVRPEWLAWLGQAWKRKIGDMEMIYDGRCAFCVRSMAWFLAFDGLGQISIRDFRSNPSPMVSDALAERALYLVLPDGRALPGFEAYRYAVLRVPGLWWLVPFFYLPVLSRLLGHPVYNWIAANRSRLSSLRLVARPLAK